MGCQGLAGKLAKSLTPIDQLELKGVAALDVVIFDMLSNLMLSLWSCSGVITNGTVISRWK